MFGKKKKELFVGFPLGMAMDIPEGQIAEWNLPVNGGFTKVFARFNLKTSKFYELVINDEKYTQCDKIVYIEFIPKEGKIIVYRRK